MQQTAIKAPAWINNEITFDMTDMWSDACDPENAEGVVVTAYLSENSSGFIALDGVCLEVPNAKSFFGPDWAERVFGRKMIGQVEEWAEEIEPDTIGNRADAAWSAH
ncbi:hypothetical protein J7400_18975 [Shimia sp. R9_2]|uniref:hypothetical protein n=1 Tax=Shimia sp. R9_2 TaxID=2821112 RepID=UPI001ADAFC27|nr:hypothetical protein [Shimia sp. R9_2]MBO9398761.1 hypothetical protein [Shimia sp. R9_2]